MNKHILAFAALLLAPPLAAVNGSFEINAACAQVGCFSGDDGSTNVIEINAQTLDSGGTFRLSSDLEVSTGSAIVISGLDHNVLLDLNGHTIACTGSCNTGIFVAAGDNSMQASVTIRNGQIAGGFLDGIRQGVTDTSTVVVEDVRFSGIRDDAIQIVTGVVRRCVFEANQFGINTSTDQGVMIESNYFVDKRQPPRQDAYFGVGRSDSCLNNLATYGSGSGSGSSLSSPGSCLQLQPNQCGDQLCQDIERPSGTESKVEG